MPQPPPVAYTTILVNMVAEGASGSSATLLAKRIGWLVRYYQHEKPKHRAKIEIDDNGKPVVFQPGKLLDLLKKTFLPDPLGASHQTLDKSLRDQCLSLWWFQGWLDELKAKRKTGSEDGPPDLDEQVRLLICNYTACAPRKGQAVTVTRQNGQDYELNGHSLLEKIAPNFHGDELDEKSKINVSQRLQQQLLILPWSDDWLAVGRKRREVARMRKLITKEMKVELLLHFFKLKKPVWKSRIPVHVPDGSGDIFDFYPGTWLDDIADNWLRELRPNVVLSQGQMTAIETLPWFLEWIGLVREQRKNRTENRKRSTSRRPSREASDDENEEDAYNTETSQQENKRPCVRKGTTPSYRSEEAPDTPVRIDAVAAA